MLHAGENDGGAADRFYSDVMRLLGEDVGTLRALPMLRDAIERDRVVGVLDAWALNNNRPIPVPQRYDDNGPKAWTCPIGFDHYFGPTPDAARAAAAKAIREGLL